MIGSNYRFGRSAKIFDLIPILAAGCLLALLTSSSAFAIGNSITYATQLKFEYQYSDYNEYTFPAIVHDDTIKYEYVDPYIRDFPEHRGLTKIVQNFGPLTQLELRYEYSGLTDTKIQNRYTCRIDHDLSPLTTIYGSYQHLGISYDSPDSTKSTGDLFSFGVKHDRSGWIKGETSLSYDRNVSSSGLTTNTIMPMAQIRWSVNSVTALSMRWDGYYAENDSGSYPSNAISVFVSRYFPTQTAVHLFTRYYYGEGSVVSWAPSIEVAQYILWNLTARLTYRYYWNEFEGEEGPEYIEGDSIDSHAIRAIVDWQFRYNMKLNAKFRKYFSNQDISMNTYLIGLELEI